MGLKEGRLIGARCEGCGQVMVPAASWHCPHCNFAELKEVELPHRGVLAQTAPITIFPSASFLGDAPFCRGYVDVATGAPAASSGSFSQPTATRSRHSAPTPAGPRHTLILFITTLPGPG